MLLGCPRRRGTFALDDNSESSSTTDDNVFVNAEEPEREATRSLSPEQTEETHTLEDLEPGDEVSPRPQVEPEDYRSLPEPETELEDPEDRLTQMFSAYGFNPFERPKPNLHFLSPSPCN